MKPVALIILDGWGERESVGGNAVRQAHTPTCDHLWNNSPHTFLQASGLAVGLPDGVMGNSEVGHLNLGAGRVVYQDLTRINEAIRTGEFAKNPTLKTLIAALQASGKTLHLLGLLSDGGVHSHLTHWLALGKIFGEAGVAVRLHCFTDGRDTSPTGGLEYVRQLHSAIASFPKMQIATVCGRYFAMDRDNRWERTQRAYDALVAGVGAATHDPLAYLAESYARHVTDEFLEPAVVCDANNQPVGLLQDGDAVLFLNFRSDRPRQLTRALAFDTFTEFPRPRRPRLAQCVCMTQYHQDFGLPVLFPPQSMTDLLGDVISRHGLRQLRVAETEKYAHVTFFFNGGVDTPFAGEERCLVPSPKEVATYDLKPQMSAATVAERACTLMREQKFDVLILNFANADMVGHTGNIPAAITAVETVDTCLAQVLAVIAEQGGAAIVTADHGNAEEMLTPEGNPHTAHTTNPVPCMLVGGPTGASLRDGGKLADLAPTILQLLDIPQPAAMTGQSLLMQNT